MRIQEKSEITSRIELLNWRMAKLSLTKSRMPLMGHFRGDGKGNKR